MKYFDEISSYDFIIFISRNAAKIAIEKFFKNFDLIKNIQLVAIGPSTAKILSSSNLENIIFPHNNVDTEGLLNLEEMQSDYDRIVHDRSADASIKFQRKVLIASVTAFL